MLSQFKELFHFYPKKFILKYNNTWNSYNYSIKDSILETQLKCDSFSSLGYYNSHTTNFIALDVDNHNNNINLLAKINHIHSIFGLSSFIVPSPRGYHMYYLFNDYISTKILVSSFTKKLIDNYIHHVEVKPTDNVGLRIPTLKLILNPSTLEPYYTNENYDEILSILKCNRYNTSEFVFDYDIDNSTKLLKSMSTSTSEMIENGTSNMYMNKYIPIWKSAGFDVNQCTDLFISKLSPSYNGSCLNRDHVYRRVKCYFKNDLLIKKYNTSLSNDDKNAIINIVNVYMENTNLSKSNLEKRITSLVNDLKLIIYAKRYNEEIMNDKAMYEFICSLYPYHRLETKRGHTPLASKFLQINRKSYIKNLKFLKSNFILELPNGRHYDVYRRSCLYYKINLNTIKSTINNKVKHLVQSLLSIVDIDNNNVSKIYKFFKRLSFNSILQYNIDFKLFIYSLTESQQTTKAVPIYRIPPWKNNSLLYTK